MVRPPYPVVVNLCAIAAQHWGLIDAAYYQINPPLLRQKPHRFANLVYAWAIERVPPDKIDEWLTELNDLLPWQTSASEAAVELESASFMAAMNQQ